jgi:SSS family solute:Na+ symporter
VDSLQIIDWIIISVVLLGTVSIGFISGKSTTKTDDDYIVSNRNMGLFAFVAVNVSTWYGGILGIGEYSYRYGVSSWFTQGLPYYIFALLFALLFAGKIRATGLLSIPAKIEKEYGKKIALIAAVLIFIITSPAPYLLTASQIIATIFNVNVELLLFFLPIPLIIYLTIGGFKTNIKVDIFLFFFMFIGFISAAIYLFNQYGGYSFLEKELPAQHLSLTGGSSFFYLLVWYLVAAWTIADPGFHQRVYSAKNAKTAKMGIFISIILWFIFDFFTNTSGLYARALMPNLSNPISAFPQLAKDILPTGIKGLFLASLFATVYTTLNSFTFLSGVTFSHDIVEKLVPKKNYNIQIFTSIGMVIATVISIILCLTLNSIIEIWYYIGSLFIPSLIFLVSGSYYKMFRMGEKMTIYQVIVTPIAGLFWFIFRDNLFQGTFLGEVEPMIVGIVVGSLFYIVNCIKYYLLPQ